MPTTPYRGYELYSDTAAPDLSASGEYNKAINAIDSDMQEEIEARISGDTELGSLLDSEEATREDADTALSAAIAKEREEREAADTAEKTAREESDRMLSEMDAGIRNGLANETQLREAADTAEETARKAADTELGERIDNAETEISANSADLTGIKGLTYGTGKQVFLENDNGEYSSPALEEIQHEIEQRVVIAQYDREKKTVTPDMATIYAHLRNGITVLIFNQSDREVFFPTLLNPTDNQTFSWVSLTTQIDDVSSLDSSSVYTHYLRSNGATGDVEWLQSTKYTPYWKRIENKPFSTIGSGLKVVSSALTVDTAALPSGGITADTTWGELEGI